MDVQTAQVIMQETAETQRGTADLRTIVLNMTRTMLGLAAEQVPRPTQTQPAQPQQSTQPAPRPAVTTPSLPAANRLTADGRKVFQSGKELSKQEVRALMVGDAMRSYNKGISRNRNGNIWIITGGVLWISGGILSLGVVDPDEKTAADEFFAQLIGGSGYVAIGTGIILKLTSKKPVRQSVEMYNRSGGRAGMELDFGITGHGVGVVLRF